MKKIIKRYFIALWWLSSAGLTFGLGYAARLLVKEPPFTDWGYTIGMAITMPSILLPVFLYMLRQKR